MSGGKRLLDVDEALALILLEARRRSLGTETVPLSRALGRVLAEPVVADLDLPPFDKALVDGFALRAADVGEAGASLRLVGEVFAGGAFDRALAPGEAVSIMTGAPLPSGADAVVMLERVDAGEGVVHIPFPVKAGQNRLTRGREFLNGQELLAPGTRLGPPRLGVAASVGRHELSVARMPRVTLVGTGDEIVPVASRPEASQIRDSNSTTLSSLLQSAGVSDIDARLVADREEDLERLFSHLLGRSADASPRDVVMISGGVSAGKKDLVPSVLSACGVREVFHKVNVKPGKPLWFGVGPSVGPHPGTLVFGLPGNPVSGLVCSLLFVVPAIEAMLGRTTTGPRLQRRPLGIDFAYREERATFHPSKLADDGAIVPLPWAGSADLKTAADAVGFVALVPGEATLKAGTIVGFLPLP